ncbi:MAG: xanthine dehydrogenase family protein molybdopterin-binding subunit [Anaerolineae bacterium]|nr:xanthine dehydrogenase family protein molybdopterin-binding subunit [Anaerolineae bacterium]
MRTKVIGQSAQRVDARAKVTGQALYPGDLTMPGMLHMKVLFAGRPHARILSIDTSAAEACPGVVAVFTAKDVPVNEYGLIMPDQPVLCGPGSDKPGADVVRFVGDQVALVVAETERAAAEARDLIRVEYEGLPVITDPREAMKPGAYQLHPDKPGNLVTHWRIRKGDVAAAFAEADVIVEEEYHTPMQEHAYLQPEAGLAYIDDEGRVTVQVAGQHAHKDVSQIAHALGLPEERVRVIYPAIGGAFGGREDMSVQIILALAAWKLRRPVKVVWSREESIIGHHKRHQYFMRHKWGAKKDGRVIAAQAELISDAGAYCYTSNKVLGNSTLLAIGVYDIPNVHVDSYAVYTNNIPAGAMRGFGAPQALFAAEQQMDRLAEKLGLDPITIRLRNCLREGSLLATQTAVPEGVSMAQVIERCAREAGWKEEKGRWVRLEKGSEGNLGEPGIRRGVGFACGFKNVGFSFGAPEGCTATIELHGGAEIEEVVLRHAAAEVGQGSHTVLAQMAAEALGVPLEKVRLVMSDTATSGDAGSASASRMTFMAGQAIRGAARLALERWRDEERPAVASYRWHAPPTTPYDAETGRCVPNFAYGYVAQAVELEVDTETGQVRVLKVVSANDVGQAVNPQLVEGQVEGGVVQALGWALMEDFQMRDGQVLTPHLSTYLIPTALDVPEAVETLVLEYADPGGPWGVRGMGEMPFLCVAPAVVSAVYDAIGVRFNALPLTPERVWRKVQGLKFE